MKKLYSTNKFSFHILTFTFSLPMNFLHVALCKFNTNASGVCILTLHFTCFVFLSFKTNKSVTKI